MPSLTPDELTVYEDLVTDRLGDPHDTACVVATAYQDGRLRGLMHLAMGTPVLTDEWRLTCEAAFRRRLAASDFVAFGVEDGGRLAQQSPQKFQNLVSFLSELQ